MTDTSDKELVSDISKPGKSAPSTTSRPIIVGHKPSVKDPMMTDDTIDKPAVVSAPSVSKRVISPIISEPKSADKMPTDITPVESTSEDAAVTEETTTPSTEAAVVDAVVDQLSPKRQKEKIDQADLEKLEHLSKLVEEKKYFLPIAHNHAGMSKGIVFTLLLAVAVASALLAADAELLPFDVPFDFL